MAIEIRPVGAESLPLYAQVPSIVRVESVLQVVPVDGGLGGLLLHEEPVEAPYLKDYDGYGEGTPTDWPRQFDLRNWGFFLAFEEEHPVAAAAVAYDTHGVHMLAGRRDLAVLWDIRVHSDCWGQGIGKMIFWHAVQWSHERGARQLKIETQNVNVRACRFYRRQGCHLGEIDRYGYAGHPRVGHEVKLIWYLDLGAVSDQLSAVSLLKADG